MKHTVIQTPNQPLALYHQRHDCNTLLLGKMLLLMLATVVASMPDFALAQIPQLTQGTVGIPGVSANTSIMKTLIMTVAFIVFVLVIAVIGFGLSDTIASFFRELNDSRKQGDWSPLIRFIGLAFAVLAIVFVIMGYINKHVIDVANAVT